ncbi:UvrD-helicase domain-containing protein [Mariniflexile gromovii]|uniref:DNA 3'-5' helicase II n=1 Tax=Mariniflexile gromovii TaxID=362523 RepID=A0ABS4BU00_9FLAO|nr:UvrD-helicase domain-containing protein [Mariniflexile gromovii]MBP0904041.1 ATP-dependent helicase [Mariniflexile gromovii]
MEIEKHIEQAEKIFINGNFDSKRKKFIKNLKTCDLLAVPGSGKTTTLIAKLYCISQNMPFEDGSGILVLAHTNHAIDEIEKKLKKHCPQLFEYPNFVGTIQSFVNRFLAIPHFTQKNKFKFKVIDDFEYKKRFDFFLKHAKDSISYFSKRDTNIFYKSRFNLDVEGNLIICNEFDNEEIKFNIPQKWINQNTEIEKITKVLDFIKDCKTKLFKEGLLHYDDCYFYSKQYLLSNKDTKKIIQKRFKYVFIDEMQDLEEYQIKIIDDIFFEEDSETIIQRIGDKNQSIYGSGKKVKQTCDWRTRQDKEPLKYKDLNIQNSLRLSPKTAVLVDKFVLERLEKYRVVGKFEESNLYPHLIIINRKTTGEQIKNKFIDLIKKYNLQQCKKNIDNGFKIVSWITEKEDENKEVYLKKLFSEYSKESKSRKEDFDCFKKYLYHYDKEKLTLESIRKSILNGFTRILDLEGIKDNKGKRYRKSTLMQFIKNQGEAFYNDFKSKLFSWCFDIVIRNKYEEVFNEMKDFISSKVFIGQNWSNEENYVPKTINQSKEFIDSEIFQPIEIVKQSATEKEEINIELASVHAVKGQTHCATMYIESAYQRPLYETNKIIKRKGKKTSNPLLLEEHMCEGTYDKQALKMMYVGFSRPTHLLCFVVLKENVEDCLDSLCHSKGGFWEVEEIRNN